MATPAAVLNILVQANGLNQTTAGLGRMNSQLASTQSQAAKTGAAVKSLAKGAIAGAAVVVAHQAVSAFVDFDRSMRNVNSIARLSEKQFDSLSKNVLKLAGPTGQAPKTLADGMYQLVSSGFDANQSMKILSKTAIAATAGLTDTATATEVVAAAINSYGLKAKDAAKVSDTLFQTVNVGVLTFEDLAQSLGPVLPAAKSLNVSLEQVGAAMATLTKQGFPAAEAATAIDTAMRALLKPSDAMKQAFKDLGVAGGEELVRKYGSLQAALQAVRNTTDGSGVSMNKLFNQIRGARGAMTLTGKNARGAAADLKLLGDASGATQKAFEEQSKSASVQWQKLKATFQVVAVQVGTVLFPILRRVLIILAAWDKFLLKLPKLWIAVGVAAFNAGKAIWAAMKDAFQKVKKVTGDVIAFVLRRFADLFDVAAKVPIIGKKFQGVADSVRKTADRVDQLGENIGHLHSKSIKITVKAALQDFESGKFKPLVPSPTGGPDLQGQIESAVGKRAQKWAVNHMDQFAPLLGTPGGMKGGLGLIQKISLAMGLSGGLGQGQGYRPGDDGYHGLGRALDNSGPANVMMAFARRMFSDFGSRLKELIYSPMGVGIKNGRPVNILDFYGPSVYSDHFDHVHVALQRGGAIPGVGSGDKVPAMLEPGEFVMNRNATRKAGPMLAALNRGVPRFQSGGMVRAAAAGRAAGFKGKALQYLLAIGGAESGNYTDFIGDGGQSFSPWQIYHPAHPQYDTHRLLSDWTYAAKAAYEISGGGSNWSPWTMFRNGGYRRYMGAAASVIARTAKKPKAHAKARARAKTKPGKPTHAPFDSRSDILGGFLSAIQDSFAMRRALAELTPDLQDDIATAFEAVAVWGSWLDIAKRNKDMAGITTAATELKAAHDWLTELTAPVDAPVDQSEAVALLQGLLGEANQRTAVSQAQYGVFRGMPAVGAPSFVSPGAAAPQVNVHVADGMSWLRQFIRTEVGQTRVSRGPLPGRGGGLQR